MERRGATHIEVILSFVLFATAIGFALYFLSPVDSSRVVDSSLGYAMTEISENITTVVKVFSLTIIDPGSGNQIVQIPLKGVQPNENPRAKNLSGNHVQVKRQNDNIYLKKERWNAKEFITLTFSEDLTAEEITISGLSPLDPTLYNLSSAGSEEVLSEKKIIELNKTYYEDYRGLKEKFNLPNRIDFGFEFNFDNLNITALNEVPSGLEVFSKNTRVEVLRSNGEMGFADLTVRVW